MQKLMQLLADRASQHWCAFRRAGKPCDHAAVTYLIGLKEGCVSGFACRDHEEQMVACGGWRDVRD